MKLKKETIRFILDHGEYKKTNEDFKCNGCGIIIASGEHYYRYLWGWQCWGFCHICNMNADFYMSK